MRCHVHRLNATTFRSNNQVVKKISAVYSDEMGQQSYLSSCRWYRGCRPISSHWSKQQCSQGSNNHQYNWHGQCKLWILRYQCICHTERRRVFLCPTSVSFESWRCACYIEVVGLVIIAYLHMNVFRLLNLNRLWFSKVRHLEDGYWIRIEKEE